MDEIVFERIIEVIGVDRLALQQAAFDPPHLTTALLVNEQPRAEPVGLDLEEAGQLLEVHGGVQLEVGADCGVEQGILDLVHEDGGLVVDGVDVDGRVVKVWRRGADELGAGGAEEFLEERERLGPAVLQAMQLFAVLLAQGRVDGVVETGRVQGHADGDQGVHLVVLLGDRVVAVATLLEVLGARHVDQDVAEHADCIAVAAHHHVRKAHVVVGGEVGGHDPGKHGFLVHLDVVERLERQAEVTQQAVHPQQPDDREVPQHLVQRATAVLAGIQQRVLPTLDGGQLLVDLRPLDERVQHVEHRVAAPCVGVLTQKLGVLLAGAAAGDTVTVAAERLELVDELVDDIPSPVVLTNKESAHRSYHLPSSLKKKKKNLKSEIYIKKKAEPTEGTSNSTGPSEFKI